VSRPAHASPSIVSGLIALTVLSLAAGACGSDEAAPGASGPTIIATTSIWADVANNVACDPSAAVQAVIPAGGDPHAFEPSLSDRGAMEDAALVVANGLDLEQGLSDTLDALDTPVLRMADEIAPDTGDPHVWFDPVRVSAALPALAESLVGAADLDVAAVDDCLTDYQEELASIDTEITAILAAIDPARRKLVTSHDSLAYFADRYGFEIVGTVVASSSTLAETNPAQLEDLARVVEREAVTAIFVDRDQSADAAIALADRVGDVEVVTLRTGTLGEAGSGADTYLGFLRTNAQLIADALG